MTPDESRGSTELLAQHFTGWLGETLDDAFLDPKRAAPKFDEIVASAERVVDQRGLRRSLDEFVGVVTGDMQPLDAFNSGSFHGVVAVARALRDELTSKTRFRKGHGAKIEKKCQAVADSLLILDFDRSVALAHEPTECRADVEPTIERAYMEGVTSALDGLVATVRGRLQRRLMSLIESNELALEREQVSTERERLATLLLICLTHHPVSRIVKLLGDRYVQVITEEKAAGNVRESTDQTNPPLALTEKGGMEARELLQVAA